ncbi:hypothetical protein Bsp3421_002270 [Burkholderia sp. FERM BP-3421]|jgi:hypothetical protein|uniref:hypothetical protein n=1 Tax=Burkholderia sp. FERM BP-3421 TaxID=1494466 RepID=UPI00235F0F9C|nr:hypothetical protein [Burkholderia sp. FERM BP-3421]WDD92273.1 hypothetical protein Bsp3421_002270 [Burkholderia sp. FERM BP-3421]
MKIDISTGNLTICGTKIPANLKLADFFSRPEYRASKKISENLPFATYKFDSKCENMNYISSLYFKGEVLIWVTIYISDARGNSGWGGWSDVDEKQKLQHLIGMLAAQGISNGQQFSWGIVEATYDPRAGASSVTVRYRS